jgi:hypothetical protein
MNLRSSDSLFADQVHRPTGNLVTPAVTKLPSALIREIGVSATTGKAGGLMEVERLKAAWPFGRWLWVQAVPDDSDVRASPALLIAVRDWPGAQPFWLSPSEAGHGRS